MSELQSSSELREVRDQSAMKAFAKELSVGLRLGGLVLLEGPMGVGKTQLIRFLVAAMGGGEEVVSPSFSIHNRYDIAGGHIDHFDFFRLKDQDDLESTGFWDVFSQPAATVIIEWSERLREWRIYDHLPMNRPRLEIALSFCEGDVVECRHVSVKWSSPPASAPLLK